MCDGGFRAADLDPLRYRVAHTHSGHFRECRYKMRHI
jgi:hypothetical protein